MNYLLRLVVAVLLQLSITQAINFSELDKDKPFDFIKDRPLQFELMGLDRAQILIELGVKGHRPLNDEEQIAYREEGTEDGEVTDYGDLIDHARSDVRGYTKGMMSLYMSSYEDLLGTKDKCELSSFTMLLGGKIFWDFAIKYLKPPGEQYQEYGDLIYFDMVLDLFKQHFQYEAELYGESIRTKKNYSSIFAIIDYNPGIFSDGTKHLVDYLEFKYVKSFAGKFLVMVFNNFDGSIKDFCQHHTTNIGPNNPDNVILSLSNLAYSSGLLNLGVTADFFIFKNLPHSNKLKDITYISNMLNWLLRESGVKTILELEQNANISEVFIDCYNNHMPSGSDFDLSIQYSSLFYSCKLFNVLDTSNTEKKNKLEKIIKSSLTNLSKSGSTFYTEIKLDAEVILALLGIVQNMSPFDRPFAGEVYGVFKTFGKGLLNRYVDGELSPEEKASKYKLLDLISSYLENINTLLNANSKSQIRKRRGKKINPKKYRKKLAGVIVGMRQQEQILRAQGLASKIHVQLKGDRFIDEFKNLLKSTEGVLEKLSRLEGAISSKKGNELANATKVIDAAVYEIDAIRDGIDVCIFKSREAQAEIRKESQEIAEGTEYYADISSSKKNTSKRLKAIKEEGGEEEEEEEPLPKKILDPSHPNDSRLKASQEQIDNFLTHLVSSSIIKANGVEIISNLFNHDPQLLVVEDLQKKLLNAFEKDYVGNDLGNHDTIKIKIPEGREAIGLCAGIKSISYSNSSIGTARGTTKEFLRQFREALIGAHVPIIDNPDHPENKEG